MSTCFPILHALNPLHTITVLMAWIARFLFFCVLAVTLASCYDSIDRFVRSPRRILALLRIAIHLFAPYIRLSFWTSSICCGPIILFVCLTTPDFKRNDSELWHEALETRCWRSQPETIFDTTVEGRFTDDLERRNAEIEERGALVLKEARRRFASRREARRAEQGKLVADGAVVGGQEVEGLQSEDGRRGPRRSGPVFARCDGFGKYDDCDKCRTRIRCLRAATIAERRRKLRLESQEEEGKEEVEPQVKRRGPFKKTRMVCKSLFTTPKEKEWWPAQPLPEIEGYFCPGAPKAKVPWDVDFEFQPFDDVNLRIPAEPVSRSTTESAQSMQLVTPQSASPPSQQRKGWDLGRFRRARRKMSEDVLAKGVLEEEQGLARSATG